MARERSGTQFAPNLVDLVAAEAGTLFTNLDGVTSWDTVIAAEPGLGRPLAESELDSAFEAIADFIDVKSPFTLGHSRGVADMAAGGAEEVQLDGGAVTHVRRAALVHDLGRLGVSNAVWDKAGELNAGEVERVRLHPYLTERMLAASPDLAALGATAVQHHERLDGSGKRRTRAHGPARHSRHRTPNHGPREPAMFVTEFGGTETVQLSASAPDVFDLLVDVDRLPEWNAHIHHVIEWPKGPLAEGAEWVIQMRAMGGRWPSRARALIVDRAALSFEHRSCSDDGNPSYALWSWRVSPGEPGSTLTVTWAAYPRSFWRKLLFARVRRPLLADEVRASLAGMDHYLRTAELDGRPVGITDPVR